MRSIITKTEYILGTKYIKYMRVSQKFCNILVHASLWHVYHVTEAIQTIEDTNVVDTLTHYTLFYCVSFESRSDECTM